MMKRRVWLPVALIVFFAALLAAALFLYSILKVDILLNEYVELLAAVLAFFLFVTGVLLLYGMRRKPSVMRRVRRILGVLLALILIAACVYGALVIFRLDRAKNNVIAKPDEQMRAIVGVYVKTEDPAQKLEDLRDHTFGVLGNLGSEKINSNYALGQINEQLNTAVSVTSYPGITDAAAALRDGEVQAIAVNKNYLSLLDDTETYSGFASNLRLVAEIRVPSTATMDNTMDLVGSDKETEIAEPTPTPSPTPEPTPVPVFGEGRTLVFFLSGVDQWEPGVSNSHSDVNILMLVNTNTRQILLINTPRDYFVENPALGGGDKLTHCGVQGVYNSIEALERLYGVSVDNYVKINFEGFIDFIDAIGGITIDNPVEFSATGIGGKLYHFPKGVITLDDREALCYVREREAFGAGDLARGKNQMRVVSAIFDRLKSGGPELMMRYAEIINIMGDCFETDLSSEQLSDLVKIALRYINDWELKGYSASGVNGMRVTASGGSEPLYIIWPTQSTVDFASKLMDMIRDDELITDEVLAEAPSEY